MPIFSAIVTGRLPGQPAITSPGSLLGLENWKRATRWCEAIVEIGRPRLRTHDRRHTYASLARCAGAELRLLQKTRGHASITVTAHIYADLYDDELDDIASRWTPSTTSAVTFGNHLPDLPTCLAGYWRDGWSAEARRFVRPAAKNIFELGL